MKGKGWTVLALGAVLIAVAGGVIWWVLWQSSPGPRENVTPPEGVVNIFYIALDDGAYSQAYGYLSESYRQTHALGGFVDAVRPIWDDVTSITVQIDTPVVEGNMAQVDVMVQATLKEGTGPDRASFQGTLRLVREGPRGAWWLGEVPYPVPGE